MVDVKSTYQRLIEQVKQIVLSGSCASVLRSGGQTYMPLAPCLRTKKNNLHGIDFIHNGLDHFRKHIFRSDCHTALTSFFFFGLYHFFGIGISDPCFVEFDEPCISHLHKSFIC